jgi:hypothetical protein
MQGKSLAALPGLVKDRGISWGRMHDAECLNDANCTRCLTGFPSKALFPRAAFFLLDFNGLR